MRLLEIAAVLIVLVFVIAQNVRGFERRYLLALGAAGLSIVGASALLEQLRWQMAPVYLLLVVLCLLLFRRPYSHVVLRSMGLALGILLLAVSVTLSFGLPVLTLPPPDGRYLVGTTSLSLVDQSRNNSFFGAPDRKRELYVQVWYPGVANQEKPEPRTLWQELHRGDLDLFTLFTRYLRGVKTHSYEGVSLSPEPSSYPIIVFSHAMVSFAEQNTLLMEHLASHGYIVFGVSHTYASMRVVSADGGAIYPNLQKINEVSAQSTAAGHDVTARLTATTGREARDALEVERFTLARGLNDLTAIWVDDLRFVVDTIVTPDRYPRLQAFANRVDTERIGFLGMSFGGGAITEVCKVDARCRAALNMDGGTFGQRQHLPLEVPYLALIREDQTVLHYLLPASHSDYYEVAVAGTTHLDFTDDTLVLPILKWLKITGPIEGERVVEIANAVSLRFFDAYLRGGPKPRFDKEFPELTVEMNGRARE